MDVAKVSVALLSFVAGYVGWFASLDLAPLLARHLTRSWPASAVVSRLLAQVIAMIWLIMLVSFTLFLVVLAAGPESLKSKDLLSSFAGLAAFGLFPRVEEYLRRTRR
jgi:hypothetical protein